MLRRDAPTAPPEQQEWRRILVPAVNRPYSVRCLEVAYRLAQNTDAVVQLVYVLEVPRTLPLDAALPESEITAVEALRIAQQVAVPYKVTVTPFVHRTRSALDGILRLVNQERIELLILGGRPDGNRGLPSDLSRELFRRAPCEVIADYIAGEK